MKLSRRLTPFCNYFRLVSVAPTLPFACGLTRIGDSSTSPGPRHQPPPTALPGLLRSSTAQPTRELGENVTVDANVSRTLVDDQGWA